MVFASIIMVMTHNCMFQQGQMGDNTLIKLRIAARSKLSNYIITLNGLSESGQIAGEHAGHELCSLSIQCCKSRYHPDR